MNHDDYDRQLRILGRLHYVGAVLASLIPIFGAAYGALGAAILLGKLPVAAPTPGRVFGWLPLAMGAFVLLFGVAAVALNLLTARSLRDCANHTLCLLTSAMNCVHFPLGTVLGIFTVVLLRRPAVSADFGSPRNVPNEPSAPGRFGPPYPPRSAASSSVAALGGGRPT